MCRGQALYHAFAVAVGFLVFCILSSIVCPNRACTQLLLVPYDFFIFSCTRRHLSRCRHHSKVSQVPDPSLSHKEIKRERRLTI